MNTKRQNNDVSHWPGPVGSARAQPCIYKTSKITKEDLRKSEGTKTPHLCIGAILTRPDSLRLFLSSSAKKETVYTYRICTALFMHVATIGSQTTTATMTWHSGHKVPTKNMKN